MAMDNSDKGKEVVRDAEQSLRLLLADAASTGDYASVKRLASWAQLLADLMNDNDTGPKSQDSERPSRPGGKRTPRTKHKSSKSRSAGYPKFVRDQEFLVKIGWSKADSKEYEHKASKSAVQALVSSISRVGRNGKRFSMDSILPQKALDGDIIPDYQSYLILAWLRTIELVEQHGRLGYTIPGNVDLVEAVDDCWNRLAERSYAGTAKDE